LSFHWVCQWRKLKKKKKFSLIKYVYWRTAWPCFSFVTKIPDFPVYSFIYFLFKVCLIVLFQALLVSKVGLLLELTTCGHDSKISKALQDCMECHRSWGMYLKLATLNLTHTKLVIHSTNIWTFSSLQSMPLKTIVSFSKKKK